MKKIVLTGGGTAGHVTPNLALLPALEKAGWEAEYIGSYDGIEKELVTKKNVPYHGIATGKFRRYRSLKNLSDPFRVMKGYFEAKKCLRAIAPSIVFSKGGFVSVPVVLAAKSLHIPVISHESDMTPGLANRISKSAATKICCNFPETVQYLPKDLAVLTGTPIRSELLSGDAKKGLEYCGLDTNSGKKTLLIIGGSTGAQHVNDAIITLLPKLLEKYQVIHLCGKGKFDESLKDTKGYAAFEYINEELPDVFAAADFVISRAGANAICELVALKKPHLLIPLSKLASRGDQVLNARSFEKQGYSMVLEEDEKEETVDGVTKKVSFVHPEKLWNALEELEKNSNTYVEAMATSSQNEAIPKIMELIQTYGK
ncbi:MAG: undecaprenyldiphospho-muramoylpentapeptide beta-N-acetylglucosaminyltransferase [Lachnospiraceae bacterium]|nr:undecaprenyldiphospho-muramoylpentapeptide beta-N-acetylglucosaminyltransferase [Lachnospiraceae bacterium]